MPTKRLTVAFDKDEISDLLGKQAEADNPDYAVANVSFNVIEKEEYDRATTHVLEDVSVSMYRRPPKDTQK